MYTTDRQLELDDLVPVREYPVIREPMTLGEGMKILAHRIGLSGAKIQALARDRYPTYRPVKKERGEIQTFRVRCFLRSDIIFSDVLHTGYGELKYLGIGRRFLMNRLFRIVLAGICDGLDPSGLAGDFPPYSWLPQLKAQRIKKIQYTALRLMKVQNARLLQSLKVRLRRVSTDVLLNLVKGERMIRKEIRKASATDPNQGLRRFSRLLDDYKKSLYRYVRREDIKNRAKARNIRVIQHPTESQRTRQKTYGKYLRCPRKYERCQYGAALYIRGMTDLRKWLDPNVPNWYRRPTDPDWYEGQWSERRKPRIMHRKASLAKYGFGGIPGLTEPLEAKDWTKANLNMNTAQAREYYREFLMRRAGMPGEQE